MDILQQAQKKTLDTKLGSITVQVPSLPKKLDIERRRSFYSGGLAVISTEGADLADAFATLDVVMIESPLPKLQGGGWDYSNLYDEDALKDAYQQTKQYLEDFRKPVASEQTQVVEN